MLFVYLKSCIIIKITIGSTLTISFDRYDLSCGSKDVEVGD